MKKPNTRQSKTTARQREGSPTAIRYVNAILYNMFQEKIRAKVLKRSEPLPLLSARGEKFKAPAFHGLIDRLKFMSGLNPVTYPAPVSGTTTLIISHVQCEVCCRFDDDSDECCRMELKRKGPAQPKAR